MPARLRPIARLLTPVLVAVPLATAVPAVPAHAAVEQQVVTFRNAFIPSEITIVAGDTLRLTNFDLERHDVTALDTFNGAPMFRSATIGPAQQALVHGVSVLAPSVYPYYCSVHEWMTGNLTVL